MVMYVLFEHAAGYALFCTEGGDLSETDVQASVFKLKKFKDLCTFVAFQPFTTGRDALENINCVSEGLLHSNLEEFLDNNLPKKKRKKIVVGVSETKLGVAIGEKLELSCTSSAVVHEFIRGIRLHFTKLVPGIDETNAANASQLGLGHSYSRARVKFNVNRNDNMIIQTISLVDQLDKDINTFAMRVREWYSHHFPELIKIVPENALFIRCVRAIRDRKNMPEGVQEELENILNDPLKVQNILEVSRNSMGMDISEVDLSNVYDFAERVIALSDRRQAMMVYLRSKMNNVAPNLAALIGDIIGARLISHAGSLINLAKAPASTVQILGAEKALFRALKTRGNTPKYGILFNTKFIAKASKSNKGRISRYLANKCSVATRIDCFREVPTDIFGTKLHNQVEERLKFFETGELPKKNIEVMDEALEEAEIAEVAIKKKAKKKAKKEKLALLSDADNSLFNGTGDSLLNGGEEEDQERKKKKKKRKLNQSQEESAPELQDLNNSGGTESPKKKKKKKHLVEIGSFNESIEVIDVDNGVSNDNELSAKKKKKKKKKANLSLEEAV